MICSKNSLSQREYLCQKTWLCLNSRGIRWRRESLIRMYPPLYSYHTKLCQNQWYTMDRLYTLYIIGLTFICSSHLTPHWPSVYFRTWPGNWSCSCWCDVWWYTVAWLTGIESGWGVVNIGFRSRASLVSPGTQWGLVLYLPTGRWHPMPPFTVVSHLSDPKQYCRSCACKFHKHTS